MAAPQTRTKSQRQARKTEIARLHARGLSQEKIAADLGMTRTNVRYWLSQLNQESAALIENRKARIIQECAMLEETISEAWAGWERSKEAKQTRSSERSTTGVARDKASIKTEDRCGDPRYLEIILKAIDRRCRLLHLDSVLAPPKPKTVDAVTAEGGGEGGLPNVIILPAEIEDIEAWVARHGLSPTAGP